MLGRRTESCFASKRSMSPSPAKLERSAANGALQLHFKDLKKALLPLVAGIGTKQFGLTDTGFSPHCSHLSHTDSKTKKFIDSLLTKDMTPKNSLSAAAEYSLVGVQLLLRRLRLEDM